MRSRPGRLQTAPQQYSVTSSWIGSGELRSALQRAVDVVVCRGPRGGSAAPRRSAGRMPGSSRLRSPASRTRRRSPARATRGAERDREVQEVRLRRPPCQCSSPGAIKTMSPAPIVSGSPPAGRRSPARRGRAAPGRRRADASRCASPASKKTLLIDHAVVGEQDGIGPHGPGEGGRPLARTACASRARGMIFIDR